MWFPICLHWETRVSLWLPSYFPLETWVFHVISPILLMGKPLVDPCFHAMEACTPERMLFPLEGNHMDTGSFQD